MSDRIHHLRPLQPVREGAVGESLDFALMAAVAHSERGETPAAWVALLDALEIMHRGEHEQISSDRFSQHLRRLRGVDDAA